MFLQKLTSKQYSQTLIIHANRCEKNMFPSFPIGSNKVNLTFEYWYLIFLIQLLT